MALHYSGLGSSPSYGRSIELYPVVEDALRRGNLRQGERVIIYTDTRKNRDIVDAFFLACKNLGADVSLVMTTPEYNAHAERSRMVIEQLKLAETVIDLASTGWIYARGYSEILDSGTRILCNMSDPDTILRMAPRDDVAERSRLGGQLIHEASEIRVTSDAGTDLTMRKDGRFGSYQTGALPKEPGGWDNLPSAQCATAPLEDSANGTLVINQGDILLTIKRFVQEPIHCTLKDGRITKIEGGLDAAILRDWLAKWQDPGSYVVAHIGFGCDPRALLESQQLMEWESYYGNVMIAFGNNAGRFLGGTNVAKSHIDIVLLNADFYLDGKKILERGEFVLEELRNPAPGARS